MAVLLLRTSRYPSLSSLFLSFASLPIPHAIRFLNLFVSLFLYPKMKIFVISNRVVKLLCKHLAYSKCSINISHYNFSLMMSSALCILLPFNFFFGCIFLRHFSNILISANNICLRLKPHKVDGKMRCFLTCGFHCSELLFLLTNIPLYPTSTPSKTINICRASLQRDI